MAPASFPWVFPYQDDPAVASEARLGRAVLRPLVECRLSAREMNERTWALVDSGSEHTLAMRWVAQAIGVEPDGDSELVLGIGGQNIRVRFADVTLHLGPHDRPEEEWIDWQAEVGFIDQFTVTMNRGAQALAVTSFDDFDSRFPPIMAG